MLDNSVNEDLQFKSGLNVQHDQTDVIGSLIGHMRHATNGRPITCDEQQTGSRV